MDIMHRVKESVPGGMIFRSVTGAWTYRLEGELFWRQVSLSSREEAINAIDQEVAND